MFTLPSPLQKIEKAFFADCGIEVYIKRDDLIHPFVSGNKLRKLKGWLDIAQKTQAETLVSFGGAYSNHLLALAFAAAVYGYKSVGIVRGNEASDNLVLKHCRLFGMEIRYVDREQYRNKDACFADMFNGQKSCLYIPEGGAGEAGLLGFEKFLQEPAMQADHYVLAAGTGTSALGISRALKKSDNTKAKVWALACVKDLSLEKLSDTNLTFNFDYTGRGFGKFDKDLVAFAQAELQQTGALFDPVYTAKAWRGLLDLIERGRIFSQGEKILFVHTGGLTGWWGM